MDLVFSSDWVHPRDRYDFWHSAACSRIVEHSSRPECRANFEAEIEAGSLGQVDLIRFRSSDMEVSHTSAAASRTPWAEFLVVTQQIAGAYDMEHNGRTIHLGPGDITVIDPLLGHEGRFSSGPNILLLKVPRRELEARIGKARDFVGRVIQPRAPENKLASTLVAALPSLTGKMNAASCDLIANHALDLLGVSMSKALVGTRPRVSSSKSVILSNVRCIVEARLADENLNAEMVAREAGLSVRYANQVLSHHDTSLTRLIQARRLERCRCALEDPSQAHRTVSEIAYGWGFSDMTHFGRRFKQAYGASPKEYRETVKRTRLSSCERG